jgi:hypothetical protein
VLLLSTLFLLVASRMPLPSVYASSPSYGNNNPDWLEVGSTCNVVGDIGLVQ